MCRLTALTGCNCTEYSGAVRMAVHRQHEVEERGLRDEDDSLDREAGVKRDRYGFVRLDAEERQHEDRG